MIAIAAAALLGWAAGLGFLKSVHPDLPAMRQLTAVGLIGLGVSLLLLRPASLTADRILGRWIALAVAALGAAAFAGQLPPHTSLGLAGAGFALWSVDRGERLERATAAVLWMMAIAAVVGYAYQVDYIDSADGNSGMSPQTAVSLLVLATGVIFLRPDRGIAGFLRSSDSGAAVARVLLPTAVIAPIALGFARLEGQRHGLFGLEVGLAITTLGSMVIVLSVVWIAATRLSAADARRREGDRSRRMLGSIAANLPVAFYQAEPGEHGRWRYVSPQIEQMLGHPSGDWIADRGLWAHLVHPDDREWVIRHETNSLAARPPGSSGAIEYRMLTRDRGTIWVRDEAVVGDDGFLDGALVDITGARAAEERFKRLLEAAPDPMVIVGEDGAIKLVNRQVERLLGYQPHELVGKSVEILVPESQRGRHAAHRAGFVEDPQTRPMGTGLDLNARRKDGTQMPVEVSLSPMESDDGLLVIAAIRDVTAQREAETALRHLAEHDPLTGLHNRRRFEEELERMVAGAARYRTPSAVMILDLDEFKEVNDALGHAAGDRLLVSVAEALQRRLRETDVLARLGGDEFAVVLTHVRSGEARTVAAALLESIRRHARVEALPEATVTASIGVALIEPGTPASAEALLSRADIAMYEAKRTGRDRFVVYGEEAGLRRQQQPRAAARAGEPRPAA